MKYSETETMCQGNVHTAILIMIRVVAKDFGYSPDEVLNTFGEFMVTCLAKGKTKKQLHAVVDEIVKNNSHRIKKTKKGKK